MSKTKQHDWNQSNIIDDVEFHQEDAHQFKNLLKHKEETAQWPLSHRLYLQSR